MNPTQGVISEAFDLYKKHFGHLVVVALVIYLAIAVLGVFAVLFGSWVGAIIVAILSVIGSFVVTAALVEAVADIRDGRADLSVSETLSRGLSRIGSVAGASILGGIAIAIGFLLLIVPGLILITWWAVIIPVIVIEHVGTFDSFSRSRELVRGFDWQVFGVIVIQFLIFIGFGICAHDCLGPLPRRGQLVRVERGERCVHRTVCRPRDDTSVLQAQSGERGTRGSAARRRPHCSAPCSFLERTGPLGPPEAQPLLVGGPGIDVYGHAL